MAISGLADVQTRRSAARWLLIVCALGFLVSVAVAAGLGYGAERWVFLLVAWTVLVYAPLRIVIESSEALGARAQRALAAQVAVDPERYTRAAHLPLLIRELASREVALPRICQPRHGRSAVDAAVALILHANTRGDARASTDAVIRGLAAVLAAEAAALGAVAMGGAADNIQARWEGSRSLGALGALIGMLVAAYTDRWGESPVVPGLEGRSLAAYLASALDYCDEVSLQVDALPWTEPPLASPPSDDAIQAIRARWRAFLSAGLPAPRALRAFVEAIFSPPAQ